MAIWKRTLTRREFLAATALSAVALAACSDDDDSATEPTPEPTNAQATTQPALPTSAATTEPQTLAPTPECGDDDDVTISQTEGPFFTPDSPERTSLIEPGITGTSLIVTGAVLSTDCRPVPGALIDFWQADDAGEYDNVGYRLRGHQFTDDNGRYRLETIVPGEYPGRTRHIHVKVQAPNRPVLTTQLYFPGDPGNANDGIFNAALVMDMQDTADGRRAAAFDFVLELS